MGNEITKLYVKGIINFKSGIDSEAAEKVFSAICKSLDSNIPVEVDFAEIDYMISAFLNVAIGQLYGHYKGKEKWLKENVHFVNMNEDDRVILNKSITRAIEYYSDKDIIDKSVSDATK